MNATPITLLRALSHHKGTIYPSHLKSGLMRIKLHAHQQEALIRRQKISYQKSWWNEQLADAQASIMALEQKLIKLGLKVERCQVIDSRFYRNDYSRTRFSFAFFLDFSKDQELPKAALDYLEKRMRLAQGEDDADGLVKMALKLRNLADQYDELALKAKMTTRTRLLRSWGALDKKVLATIGE